MFRMRDVLNDRTVLEKWKRQKLNLVDIIKTLSHVSRITESGEEKHG